MVTETILAFKNNVLKFNHSIKPPLIITFPNIPFTTFFQI
jgi:hypothetical protein